jgi:lipopolysaccharide transport system ATP-binding protein
MTKIVIRAQGLGKQYRIGQRQRYKTLRDVLTNVIQFPFRALRSVVHRSESAKRRDAFIWALRDVSFEIQKGDAVGIIGRNGAGKSTLLKILSKITEPTEGFVDIYGRVGSLLEVGTGFHPELTGRENVYLNGSIIGMRKREIDKRFDEIVAFAEIDQFLDTPVKFYSTGMHMRLAFAVAAHLEPEILIVDEVLAVGDAAFQKKCLGRMGEVAKEGRTVLFVSHNMPAVRSLCRKALILDEGRLKHSGTADECVDRYLAEAADGLRRAKIEFANQSNRELQISSAAVICNDQENATTHMGDCLELRVEFSSKTLIRHPRVGFVIRNSDGLPIISANNRYQQSSRYSVPVRSGTIRCDLGVVPLAAGDYAIDLFLGDESTDTHTVEAALTFEVIEKDIWGNAQVPPPRVSSLWWPTKFILTTCEISN